MQRPPLRDGQMNLGDCLVSWLDHYQHGTSFRDDGEEFVAIRNAMKVLEMTDQEVWDILKVPFSNRFSFWICLEWI